MGDSADSPYQGDQSDKPADEAAEADDPAGSDNPARDEKLADRADDSTDQGDDPGKYAGPPEATGAVTADRGDRAADPDRTWSRVDRALAGVVAIWVLGLGALLAVRDESPPEPSDTPTEVVTAEIPEREDPPAAAEVVEALEVSTGFTPGEVIACAHPAGDETGFYPSADRCPEENRDVIGEAVSYGIVVRNTSDHLLRGITVSYRFLDPDGEPIAQPENIFSPQDRINHEERLLQLEPGEEAGLGSMRYLEHNDVAAMDVGIVEDVEVVPMEHYENFELPQAERQPNFDPLDVSVSDVEVSYGEPDGEPVVNYTIESHQDVPANLTTATVIFRDAEGEIIGGADGGAGNDWGAVTVPPDESVTGEVALDDPMEVPGIDPDRTEVHLFPHHP